MSDPLDGKTVGEVLADSELTQHTLATFSWWTRVRLWSRHVNRSGAYIRLRKNGHSDETAATIVEMMYPMSIFDAIYFRVRKARFYEKANRKATSALEKQIAKEKANADHTSAAN